MRRITLTTSLLGLAILTGLAWSGEPRPAGRKDANGDPLPPGAVRRLGTARLRTEGLILSMAFAPDGTTMASASSDGIVRLWEVATGKEIRQLKGHEEVTRHYSGRRDGKGRDVRAVAFAPNGRMLASGGEDGTVRLWDAATGKELRQLDSHRVAVELPTGKRIHRGPVRSIAYAPDGKTLASVCGRRQHLTPDPESGIVRLSDTVTGKLIHQFKAGELGNVSAAAFTPDGKTLAAGSYNEMVRLWDVASGKELRQFRHPSGLAFVAFAPDGKTLASGGEDGTIRLWEGATGKQLRVLRGHEKAFAVAFAPDGKTVTSGCMDRSVRMWETATGQERLVLKGQPGAPLSIAWSPDGRMLATGHADGTMLLWDRFGLAAQPTGRLLAPQWERLWAELRGDNAIRAYRATGQLVQATDQAVPWLRRRLKPVPTDPQRVATLIDHLDSKSFPIRQQATTDLEKLGDQVEGELRRRLAARPALEMTRRLEDLLIKLQGPLTGEALRRWRGVEVLELIGTPEAQGVLREVVKTAENTRLAIEAQVALERLKKRSDK